MKKALSVLLVLAMLAAIVPQTVSATYQYGTNIVPNGDMESTISAPLEANESDEGQSATLTQIAKEPLMQANNVMKITGRAGGTKTCGLMYDVTSILRDKDALNQYKYLAANGSFYMTAKIKLVNPSDTAYVRPGIFTTGTANASNFISDGTLYCAVNGTSWTECGIRPDGTNYWWIGDLRGKQTATEFDLANFKAKIMFSVSEGSTSGSAAYLGDYYVDDVSLFFIAGNTTWSQASPRGTNLLDNGSFETMVSGSPIDYNSLSSWTGAENSWMKETPATIAVEKIMEPIGGGAPVEPAGVHSGDFGLKVTNRPGAQQGLAASLKSLVGSLATQPGETWHMSCWMKTTVTGTTLSIIPIWGGATGGNAYLNGDGGMAITVTDQWTQIGINSSTGEYYSFRQEGLTTDDFNPNSGGWSSIRFNTVGSTADYYIDDVKVWKTGVSTAADIETEIENLPAVINIMPSDRAAIETARTNYDSLPAGEKLVVTNLAVLEAAEAELAKFSTKMTFPGEINIVGGFAVTQPGRTKADVLADILAAHGSFDIKSASDQAVSGTALTGSGMKVVLTYKTVELQSIQFAVLGDMDGDGKCGLTDIVTIQKNILTGLALNQMQLVSADFDGTGTINANAIIAMKKYLLGLEDSLYIPQGENPE